MERTISEQKILKMIQLYSDRIDAFREAEVVNIKEYKSVINNYMIWNSYYKKIKLIKKGL